MGCPVSGTQEDRELVATQTVLISSPLNDGHTLDEFKPDECLSKHSSGLWCLWCQYHFFSSLSGRSLLPISNHAHQTSLIFVIQCWAASNGCLTIANEKEQTRECQKPVVASFYSYKHGGAKQSFQDGPIFFFSFLCFSKHL